MDAFKDASMTTNKGLRPGRLAERRSWKRRAKQPFATLCQMVQILRAYVLLSSARDLSSHCVMDIVVRAKKRILAVARFVRSNSVAQAFSKQTTLSPRAELLVGDIRKIRETVSDLAVEVLQLRRRVEELRGVVVSETTTPEVQHLGSRRLLVEPPPRAPVAFPSGEVTDSGLELFHFEHSQSDSPRDSVEDGSGKRRVRATVDWVAWGITQLSDDSSFVGRPVKPGGRRFDTFRILRPRQSDRLPPIPGSKRKVLSGGDLGLLAMGSLLIIASQVLGPDEDAAAQGRRLESHNPLERPWAARAEDPGFPVRPPDYEDPLVSADTRIDGLAGELPSDVEEEQIRREGVAQARAAQLAASVRPRVDEALSLIRATLAKAALQGLVRVESISDPPLPESLVMSSYQLRGRSRSLEGSGLVVSFSGNLQWKVYVEPGSVRYPGDLAERSEGMEVSYPTLRVIENGTILATVGFDPRTADLTITAGDGASRFSRALDLLKREYQREELVGMAILDLLRDTQVHRPTLGSS